MDKVRFQTDSAISAQPQEGEELAGLGKPLTSWCVPAGIKSATYGFEGHRS